MFFLSFSCKKNKITCMMKFYLVAFATLFAMFWDELVITIITLVMGKQVNRVFMIGWMICSGILSSVLVSYHVPVEYRLTTVVLITFAVVFSLQGYLLAKDGDDKEQGHVPK